LYQRLGKPDSGGLVIDDANKCCGACFTVAMFFGLVIRVE